MAEGAPTGIARVRALDRDPRRQGARHYFVRVANQDGCGACGRRRDDGVHLTEPANYRGAKAS